MENIITSYKTANAVASANPGLIQVVTRGFSIDIPVGAEVLPQLW